MNQFIFIIWIKNAVKCTSNVEYCKCQNQFKWRQWPSLSLQVRTIKLNAGEVKTVTAAQKKKLLQQILKGNVTIQVMHSSPWAKLFKHEPKKVTCFEIHYFSFQAGYELMLCPKHFKSSKHPLLIRVINRIHQHTMPPYNQSRMCSSPLGLMKIPWLSVDFWTKVRDGKQFAFCTISILHQQTHYPNETSLQLHSTRTHEWQLQNGSQINRPTIIFQETLQTTHGKKNLSYK